MSRIISFFDKVRFKLGLGHLASKVMIGVSLILVLTTGIFTYNDMVSRVEFHLKEHEKRAYEISQTVLRSIAYPMLDGEMEAVQAILERLITLEDVLIVNLYNTEGTIKYSGAPANIGKVDSSVIAKEALLTSSLVSNLKMLGGEKVFRYAMPIPNEPTCYKCHGAAKKALGVLTVGISWTPIEKSIAAMRNKEITLGVVSVIVVSFFLILFLARYVTGPLVTLTHLADEISRGKPGFEFGRTLKCWKELKCEKTDCPAYGRWEIMCWYINGTLCWGEPSGRFPEKLDKCRECIVYETHVGDEIVQLADSFKHMLYRVRLFEEELKKSEVKYRFLFDYDPSSIFVLDFETLKVVDANIHAEEVYGYGKRELVGKSFTELGTYEYTEGVLSPKRNTLSVESSVYTKIEQLRKDGSSFFVNVYASHARPVGEMGIIIATAVDITDRLAKEAQLIQASKMSTLGEMATGVAHELNQPLTTIQISADFISNLIKEGQKIPEVELKIASEEMKGQVERAVRIINHLREFGRKPEMQREEININKPIEGVFTLLGQQLKVRGIKIVLDLKDDLPPIMGDNNRLEQVFIDMVINARDAMEEKKERWAGGDLENTLTIRSFEQDGHVVVTITDTGTGIPDGMKEKIFEPFFTTKEVGKGTGLGLAISYGIVKEYDGTIEVESEGGNGTTFRISFPACSEGRKGV
jgi:PAS domain S-box-containing protein